MPTVASDADLVRRYLDGDQRALGEIYERYGDRVYDLCFAMVSSADDAADAYQDTFLTAAHKLGQLRDPERLRSWLYSVARNQCRARLRARKRSTPDEDAGADVGVEVDMTADLDRVELRELMAEASAGLNERDREVLELHMRHELEGEELADVLGVSVQNAYKLVQRVRDRVERSLGSLLVARHGRRECADLDTLLADWDGAFSPLMRKRISRHIDDCETCSRRRAGLMDPGGLAGAFPLRAAPESLRAGLHATLLEAPAPTHEIRRWRSDGFPAGPRRIPKRLLGAAAAGVLFIGAIAGGLALTEVLDGSESRLETVAPVTEEPNESPAEEAPVSTTTLAPTTTTAAPSTTTTTTTAVTTVPPASAPTTTTTPPATTAPTTAPPTTTTPPSTSTSTTSTTTTSTTTTSTTTTAAPDTTRPVIRTVTNPTGTANIRWEQNAASPCGAEAILVEVTAGDNVGITSMVGSWADNFGAGAGSGTFTLTSANGTAWSGSFAVPAGPLATYTELSITVTAEDAAGNSTTAGSNSGPVGVFDCN